MKRYVSTALVTLGMSLGAVHVANATPGLAKECTFGSQIVKPDSSTVKHNDGDGDIFFSEDCGTAYIKPPAKGTAKLTSFLKHTNTGFCPTIQILIDVDKQYSLTLSSLATAIDAETKKIALDNPVLETARLEMAAADKAKLIAKGDLDQANLINAILLKNYTSTSNNYSLCSIPPPPGVPARDCTATYNLMLSAYNAYVDDLVKNVWPAEDVLTAASATYAVALSSYNFYNSQHAQLGVTLASLQTLAQQIRNSAMGLYKEYLVMAGGLAKLSYDTHYSAEVAAYQANNPSIAINWRQMLVKDAGLYATVSGTAATPGLKGQEMVLAAAIPGGPNAGYFKTTGVAAMPDGNNSAAFADPSFMDLHVPYPEAFTATATLALAGTCPLLDPANVQLAEGNVQAVFNFLVDASYDLKAHQGYTATYNRAVIAERIESVSTSGGFFSSSSHHDLTESQATTGEFVITWQADAAGATAKSDLDKAEIEKQVRERLYNLVLADIATPLPWPAGSSGLPQLGVTPASRYGAVLRNSCYFGGGYTCYAGWVIGVADSIFGHSSASSNYKLIHKADETETVSDVFFVTYGSRTSFE